jgi:hypothetical protein
MNPFPQILEGETFKPKNEALFGKRLIEWVLANAAGYQKSYR